MSGPDTEASPPEALREGGRGIGAGRDSATLILVMELPMRQCCTGPLARTSDTFCKELADAQDLRMWKTTSVYECFQRLTLGSVRQNWGVFGGFGESFGESSGIYAQTTGRWSCRSRA